MYVDRTKLASQCLAEQLALWAYLGHALIDAIDGAVRYRIVGSICGNALHTLLQVIFRQRVLVAEFGLDRE